MNSGKANWHLLDGVAASGRMTIPFSITGLVRQAAFPFDCQ
jgi:hypothetical protein